MPILYSALTGAARGCTADRAPPPGDHQRRDDRGDNGLVQNHDDASPFVIWQARAISRLFNGRRSSRGTSQSIASKVRSALWPLNPPNPRMRIRKIPESPV